MIGRLLDRVPEKWAERWARRLNLVHVVFMLCYLLAWWFLGLKVLATRELSAGAATFAGFGWVPVMMIWLVVQGIHTHHQFRHGRRVMADLDRTHDEMMEHARKVRSQIDDHRRQEMGLPPADPPPALH